MTDSAALTLKPGFKMLITAGAAGIGRTIADTFADHGARVWVCDIAEEALEACRAERPDYGVVRCDVAEEAQIDAFFDQAVANLGGLDLLVNNASAWNPAAEICQEEWDDTLELNLTVPVFLAQAAAEAMQEGVIVNLTDWGVSRPHPRQIAYFAAKGGLEAATRGLAAAFAPKIRVVAIAPGAIWVKNEAAAAAATLLERVGGAQSVADSVLFAAKNDFLTGTTLTIDGGRSLK